MWRGVFSKSSSAPSIDEMVQAHLITGDKEVATTPIGIVIGSLCALVIEGKYEQANTALRGATGLHDSERNQIRAAFNRYFLFDRSREWTGHGIWKTFRFWSLTEKRQYLERVNGLIQSLKQLTPHVSFGFGSVLGFVRENDFIPHDDDMDVIVAFPAEKSSSFGKMKHLIWTHLERQGLSVYNENPTHITSVSCDIFIGFIEDKDKVSWFPSKRSGLHLSDIFPTITRRILEVPCEIPRNFGHYLEVTYGKDWRSPSSNFKHPWDQSQYRDFNIGESAADGARALQAEKIVSVPPASPH